MASFPQLLVLFGFHNSQSEAEQSIGFHSYVCAGAVCMDSPGFVWLLSHSSWFCLASTTRLIQIRNGSDFILTFEQLAWILSWFMRLLSHNSWFCLASTYFLIQILNGAEHRISLLPLNSLYGFSPGFVRLLSHSSWFCAASTT